MPAIVSVGVFIGLHSHAPYNKCYSDKCPLEKCHTRDLIYPQKKSFSYKVSTMNSHDTMSSSSRASET